MPGAPSSSGAQRPAPGRRRGRPSPARRHLARARPQQVQRRVDVRLRRSTRSPCPRSRPARRPGGSALRPRDRRRPGGRRRGVRRACRSASCSSGPVAPSSRISPRTAQLRRPPAASATSASSAADIDSGLALYASLTTVTPSARSVTSMRQRLRGCGRGQNRRRSRRAARPASRPTAAAASALRTWCAPTSAQRDQGRSGRRGQPEPRPPARRARRRSARTSASGDVPNVTTRATVRAGHRGHQRVVGVQHGQRRSAGSASTSSPLASAIASRLPNSPRWALPTLRTTPIRGGAMAVSSRDVADATRAHLQHQVSGVGRRREHGQRQPDLVVVRPDGGHGRPGRLEQRRR